MPDVERLIEARRADRTPQIQSYADAILARNPTNRFALRARGDLLVAELVLDLSPLLVHGHADDVADVGRRLLGRAEVEIVMWSSTLLDHLGLSTPEAEKPPPPSRELLRIGSRIACLARWWLRERGRPSHFRIETPIGLSFLRLGQASAPRRISNLRRYLLGSSPVPPLHLRICERWDVHAEPQNTPHRCLFPGRAPVPERGRLRPRGRAIVRRVREADGPQ